jgi:hypothetical protein
MYVGRDVGIGKNQIRKAICKFFLKITSATHTKNCCFYSKCIYINTFIHRFINTFIDRFINKPKYGLIKIKYTKGNWPNIDYIIFDKKSMIGCTMLANMHLKLQNLKSKIQQPSQSINIIF